MTDEDFQYWKQWVERHIKEYDRIARTVFIKGFFEGISPDTVFTAAQVSEILSLERPETQRQIKREESTHG